MTVDLELGELEFLMQLVNQDFCAKQRATHEPTPFEAGVCRKLADVRQKLMEEKFPPPVQMSEIDDLSELLGKPGESVPVVDAADLKMVWTYGQTLKVEHGEGVAVGMSVWKQLLAPSVDIRAICYRLGMLSMLEMMLRAAWIVGEPSENAFKVAARMDLNWPQVGIVRNGFLFNLEGFLAEVQYEAFIHTSGKADN